MHFFWIKEFHIDRLRVDAVQVCSILITEKKMGNGFQMSMVGIKTSIGEFLKGLKFYC